MKYLRKSPGAERIKSYLCEMLRGVGNGTPPKVIACGPLIVDDNTFYWMESFRFLHRLFIPFRFIVYFFSFLAIAEDRQVRYLL